MTAPAGYLWPGHVFCSLTWLSVWVPAAPDNKSEPQATQLSTQSRQRRDQTVGLLDFPGAVLRSNLDEIID